jgi:hypothetical protein
VRYSDGKAGYFMSQDDFSLYVTGISGQVNAHQEMYCEMILPAGGHALALLLMCLLRACLCHSRSTA